MSKNADLTSMVAKFVDKEGSGSARNQMFGSQVSLSITQILKTLIYTAGLKRFLKLRHTFTGTTAVCTMFLKRPTEGSTSSVE